MWKIIYTLYIPKPELIFLLVYNIYWDKFVEYAVLSFVLQHTYLLIRMIILHISSDKKYESLDV